MAGKSEILKWFDGFVHGLSSKDRIALLYHTDADGLCAAVCALRALSELNLKPKLVFHQMPTEIFISEKTISKLRKAKINVLITLDLCVDQKPESVRAVEKFARVLVIDHHKVYHDLNSRQTVMVKSQFISGMDGGSYPASKLTYDLFSRIVEIEGASWVAAVGIKGDVAAGAWKEFIGAVVAKHKASHDELAFAERTICAVESLCPGKLDSLLKEFARAKKPSALKKSKFAKLVPRLEAETRRLVSLAMRSAENYPELELVFCNLKGMHYMKSAVINCISREQFPGKTVVVVLDSGEEFLKFSARRQDSKVRVNDLLEEAVKGLRDASAGGHAPAAAGRVRRKDFGKFRERLLEALQKLYSKR